MLSENNKNSSSPEGYQNRILELEAELEAAQKLIADQHQILKSNLAATAAAGDKETVHPASETPLPPLKPLREEALKSRPPVRLPDFGPPVGDIAERVFQAAGDKGTAAAPAAPPDAAPGTPTSGIVADTNNMPGFKPVKPARSLSRSLIISGALLLGAVLMAGLWSTFASKDNVKALSQTRRTVAPASQSIVMNRPATDSVKTSSGPVLDPVAVNPKPTLKRHIASKRKALVNHPRSLSAAVDNPTVTDRSDMRPAVPFHAANTLERRPKLHRHRVSNSDSEEDWFDREARRHPEPGWDEKEDRWLDNFQ